MGWTGVGGQNWGGQNGPAGRNPPASRTNGLLGVERNAIDRALVPRQAVLNGGGSVVPDVDVAVCRATANMLAVGRPRHLDEVPLKVVLRAWREGRRIKGRG